MPPFDPTQPQPYSAPIQGYSWAGQPPQSLNPFVTAGTSMIQDYAMMRQQGEVRQYQQMMSQPPQMSPWAQAAVAYTPQYNFGVVGGQFNTWSEVQRQSQLSAGAFATMGAAVGGTWPLFGAADAAAGAMLTRAGLFTSGSNMAKFARFGIGGAAGMIATAPFQMIAERGIERARWSADIERDIEQYAPRWTGGAGFGRAETKGLARDLMSSMQDTPDFFRPQDQLKISKMGLASGMLKGRSTDEYKRNFEDLKKNVQDVVQLMNTTVEGGLSVMKELQGAGFNSPGAIRTQVMQAKAWGMVSGVGTQNMLSLGAAGAQAAIGTGWSAQAASNMYQGAATAISQMSLGNANIANAVRGMGGITQAGAATAGAMMNVMRSGMGVQTMAYMMDPTTRVLDRDRLNNLVSGKVDSMGIIAGANRFGMAGGRGGANNRVLFEKYANRNWNSMSLMEQAASTGSIFKAWAGTRGGVNEASAYVFAKMFTQTPEQAEVFSDLLMNPGQMVNLAAGKNMNEYMLRSANRQPTNKITQFARDTFREINNTMSRAGDSAYGFFGKRANEVGQVLRMGVNAAFATADPSAMIFETVRLQPSQAMAHKMYGANVLTNTDISNLRGAAARRGGLRGPMSDKFSNEFSRMVHNKTSEELNMLLENWAGALDSRQDPTRMSSIIKGFDLAGNTNLKNLMQNAASSRELYNNFSNKTLKGNDEYWQGQKTLKEWNGDPKKYKNIEVLNDLSYRLNQLVVDQGVKPSDAVDKIVSDSQKIGKPISQEMQTALRAKTGVTKNVEVPNVRFDAYSVSRKDAEASRQWLSSQGWRRVTKETIGIFGSKAMYEQSGKYGPEVPRSIIASGRQEEWLSAISGKTGKEISTISSRDFGVSSTTSGFSADTWSKVAGMESFKKNVGNVQKMKDQDIIEKYASRTGYLRKQFGYDDSVQGVMDKLFSKNAKDITKGDLSILQGTFGSAMGTNNFKSASQALQTLAGGMEKAGANEVNTAMVRILDEMKKELVTANELAKKAPGKDEAENKKIAEAKARAEDLAVKIKNSDQQTASASTSQDSQTAAPNILNYWNNKWMM